MTGLVRKATLFSACGLLLAGAAMASVPDAAQSTIPTNILVVGENGSGPDPAGAFTVTVNDLGGNPIANSSVVVDVSGASDIALCTDVVAGQIVDCVSQTVRGVTDLAGQVTMYVVGGGNNTGASGGVAAPGSGTFAVSITADGVNLGSIHVAAVLDQNGTIGGNGHNAADLGAFGDDVGSASLFGTYRARSDYNYDEANNGVDLGTFSDYLGASALGVGSALGCPSGTYCP